MANACGATGCEEVFTLPVEARHSDGGAPGKAGAIVTIKNVAPQSV